MNMVNNPPDDHNPNGQPIYSRIREVVQEIPEGTVTTYGRISKIVSNGCIARTVGNCLDALEPDAPEPWHRVIKQNGRLSQRDSWTNPRLQWELLIAEGVEFEPDDPEGHVDLDVFLWQDPYP